jgi:hypothetical protein
MMTAEVTGSRLAAAGLAGSGLAAAGGVWQQADNVIPIALTLPALRASLPLPAGEGGRRARRSRVGRVRVETE